MNNDFQCALKSLLFRVIDIFDENGINYWLAFGSVLGAARHSGFIPWDDDIDIYFDGKDYNKIKELISNKTNDNIAFHDFSTQNDYPFTFPKIIDSRTLLVEKRFQNTSYKSGVYIDLFPLFKTSDNRIVRFLQSKKRYINYCIVESHYYNTDADHRLSSKIFSQILRRFSTTKAQTRILNMVKRGIGNTKYLVHPIRFNDKKIHKTENFVAYDLLNFEGRITRVPYDYKKYLSEQYGDYMQLPPIEKRTSVHDFVELVIPEEAKE